MRRFLISLALAACSHSAAPATTTTTGAASGSATAEAPKSQCAQVADHLVGLMSAKSVATPEQMDPFRKVIATRCDQDLWTAQAQQCFMGANSLDDADRCQPTLTQSQQDALQRDGQAAAGPGAGGGAPTGAAAPASAPAPAAPPDNGRKTRGPAKPGGDPCEGGE
jgi:hypothetical protein